MSADLSSRARRIASLAFASFALGACSWFTDFKQQPKLDPWESVSDTVPPRGAPQNSVPITGTQLAGYQISYAPLPGVIDSIGVGSAWRTAGTFGRLQAPLASTTQRQRMSPSPVTI